ncbi:hypothetical protein L596_001818 [Steinernema carpocapsae]|uniref:SXP/RAL-2 family protein Ani s 5-like cation-binding domain-containing protein n=1 Tax=Steinernema carpocapsae TaxID=34508 RepID=A0A4U8UND8_STECR|nr:hypothetical protein L596_001818 [Steinernema carpocapsae]
MSSPSLTHALLSLAAATLLLVSLSTPFCRANPVAIAPINVSGRRVYPYAGGRQTFQSYPVSINVVPGSGGGFQQEDPFKMMGGGGNDPTGQFGAHGMINPMNPVHVMSPESRMNTFGLQNPMNPSFGPMGPFGAQGPNTFGGSQGQMNTFGSQPSPFYRPSPFGPPQMGSSNSIVGPMFQAAHVSEITQHTDDQPIPKTPSSAEQPGPPQPPGQQSEGLPGMPGAPTPSGNQAKLPPFLEGTSKSVQNRFFEIVQNRNDPYDDKQKKLDELIDQLDDSHKTQYNEFVEAKAKEEEEKRQKVHTIVATMSDEAQTQFAKISTLLRNPNIGDAERWQKVQGIYESMTPKLKEEFEAKFTAYG